jgi:hypothetical protein
MTSHATSPLRQPGAAPSVGVGMEYDVRPEGWRRQAQTPDLCVCGEVRQRAALEPRQGRDKGGDGRRRQPRRGDQSEPRRGGEADGGIQER